MSHDYMYSSLLHVHYLCITSALHVYYMCITCALLVHYLCITCALLVGVWKEETFRRALHLHCMCVCGRKVTCATLYENYMCICELTTHTHTYIHTHTRTHAQTYIHTRRHACIHSIERPKRATVYIYICGR